MYTKLLAIANNIIQHGSARLIAAILNEIKGKEISTQTAAMINNIIEGLQLASTLQELMAYAQIHLLRLRNEPNGLALYAFYLKEIRQYIVFSLRAPEQTLPEPDFALYSALEIKKLSASWHNSKARFELDASESLKLSFGEGNFVNLHAKQIKLQNSNLSQNQKNTKQLKILDVVREANLKWEIIQNAKTPENLIQEFPDATYVELSPTITEFKIKLDTNDNYYIRLLWNTAPKNNERNIAELSFEEAALSAKYWHKGIERNLTFSDRETEKLFKEGSANFQGFSVRKALELIGLLNKYTSWDSFQHAARKEFPGSNPEQVSVNGKPTYSVRINDCVRLLFDMPQSGSYAAHVRIHMNYHDLLN
ncbi:hypothetical protein NO1_2069 [Candidatus Termititenax aidoneus]|uniref:Uncharacterized protein n=1 Tax=Termititenax aidoneus TaxID=2218524 RepID=A0A388TDJ3_TERA1|nr:hypothetical protein NO1_2069 [Candidatus Termititenax aidoneus]